MIIFDDLSFQTRSDVPCGDWTGGKARYTVDDNSPLGEKIIRGRGVFELIEDADGNLVDVLFTDPVNTLSLEKGDEIVTEDTGGEIVIEDTGNE